MTGDAFRLRLHVFGLAAQLGVLVRELPGLSVWDAEAFSDGRVVVAPITSVLTYYVALHELGHAAMWPLARVTGAGLWERECQCHAWSRSVALVEPDAETVAEIERALGSYREGGAAGIGGLR